MDLSGEFKDVFTLKLDQGDQKIEHLIFGEQPK
jgi:hypothetical protein